MFRRSHLKILLIGNAGVGKSALMNQYVNNRFSTRYRATIGADFLSKELTVDGRTITVQIWDTAGTERFQALGTALYRGSDCCFLVFDVTSASSFDGLEKWHKQLLLQIEPEDGPFPIAVIGNKTDLENREVTTEEGQEWSRLHDAQYFETSAKAATNVQAVFEWAIQNVMRYRKTSMLPPEPNSVHLESKPPEGAAREKCSC